MRLVLPGTGGPERIEPHILYITGLTNVHGVTRGDCGDVPLPDFWRIDNDRQAGTQAPTAALSLGSSLASVAPNAVPF